MVTDAQAPHSASSPAAPDESLSSHTAQIASALLALKYEDIPQSVVALAKRLIVDGLLVAAGGSDAQGSAQILQAVPISDGASSIWFADSPARHPTDATFANTVHMAALDYDSVNGNVHADLVSLPAAWAVAEATQASGKAFLTAFIAASELVRRLSRGAAPIVPGWTGTTLYGGIGAAAAAGKLLGLKHTSLRDAFGLALAQATGTQQANVEQVLSKKIQPALAARHGVFSAYLAQAGVTAPRFALEGQFGLRAMTQPGNDQSEITALWGAHGSDWQFSDTAIKRYPVCACGHAALHACEALLAQHQIAPGDALEVVVNLSPVDARLVSGFTLGDDPQVTAQLSLPYQLASLLVRGKIGLRDIQPAAVLDPDTLALIPRITVVADASIDNVGKKGQLAIRTASQGWLKASCDVVPGTKDTPLSDAQWHDKLRELAHSVNPPRSSQVVERLLLAVDGLEHASTLRGFLNIKGFQ